MPKIKGWEKVAWESSFGYPTWKNKNTGDVLLVRKYKALNRWYIESPQRRLQKKLKGRNVWTTKKYAIKQAIRYMREHPRG